MYNSKSNYESTVQYLYSLQKHGIKLGLANTEALMHLLNRPHTAFRSIHIAGTNGKGSTATALASMLSANGLKVGLFTSPHLVSFTERIRINSRKIDESDVIDLASKIRTVLAKHTGQPMEKIAHDTDRDFYLTPEQAQEYGLIDGILSEPAKKEA